MLPGPTSQPVASTPQTDVAVSHPVDPSIWTAGQWKYGKSEDALHGKTSDVFQLDGTYLSEDLAIPARDFKQFLTGHELIVGVATIWGKQAVIQFDLPNADRVA